MVSSVPDPPSEKIVLRTGFRLVSQAYSTLASFAKHGVGKRQLRNSSKPGHDQPIHADLIAEGIALSFLGDSLLGKWLQRRGIPPDKWIFGEETLDDPEVPATLDDVDFPVAYLDMLDGSKLWELEMSNWCTAALFAVPRSGRILGAFICDALGRVYFATEFHDGAYRVRHNVDPYRWRQEAVRIDPISHRKPHRRPARLSDAFVCFTGQRRLRFLEFAKKRRLLEVIDQEKGRIFNLGGNPMLVRVADGGMDIVLELRGQKPHDAVPGIYLALKAKAAVFDLRSQRQIGVGSPLIASALRHPKEGRLSYVAAATPQLGRKVLRLVSRPK